MCEVSEIVTLPPTLAGCADRLYQVRELRYAKQKEVKELEREETALETYIIDELPKSEATGIAGKIARVTVVNKIKARVTDWPKFYAYIARTKSFDLLQRRVGEAAIKARWDDNKQVPGVDHYQYPEVSINKV
jgi:hypothetical protein